MAGLEDEYSVVDVSHEVVVAGRLFIHRKGFVPNVFFAADDHEAKDGADLIPNGCSTDLLPVLVECGEDVGSD